MKKFMLLVLAFGAFALNQTTAQNLYSLSGKEFMVMINKADMPDQSTEIQDTWTFTSSKGASKYLASKGGKAAKFTEQKDGYKTNFTMTLDAGNGETWVFDGFMEDNHMGGTITVTQNGQTVDNLIFRGMTTQLWNANQQMKANQGSTNTN